jgi:hypothetical protein
LFKEWQNRVTSSNCRSIIKEENPFIPNPFSKSKNSTQHANAPAPCKWGNDKEENAIKA